MATKVELNVKDSPTIPLGGLFSGDAYIYDSGRQGKRLMMVIAHLGESLKIVDILDGKTHQLPADTEVRKVKTLKIETEF